MCKIITFNFNNLEVRTATKDNDILFCLVDVAKCLDIANNRNLLGRLDKDGVRSMDVTDTLGRQQEANFINEPNLYRVIFRSDKPEAVKFQDWVFNEVLPALRKDGKYELGKNDELIKKQQNPNMTIKANNNNLLEQNILDQINKIDPNNFDAYQYYYMNDLILHYPYFRFKIDKNTKLPLIQIWDWYKIIGEEKNYLHPRQFRYSVNPNNCEFKRYLDPAYMEQETIEFESVYSWAEFCKEDKLYKAILKYLDDFKTKYKNALDNSLLEKIQSGNRQLKNNISPNSNFLEEKKIFSL
jgi:prophage antirepressor-like protein